MKISTLDAETKTHANGVQKPNAAKLSKKDNRRNAISWLAKANVCFLWLVKTRLIYMQNYTTSRYTMNGQVHL